MKLFKTRSELLATVEAQEQLITHQEATILGMCGEMRQVMETAEKIAALFSPAERDLLQHKKEDAIYAPGFGPRVYFTRESLVSEHGFTEAEADTFVDLVHEMDERREEQA